MAVGRVWGGAGGLIIPEVVLAVAGGTLSALGLPTDIKGIRAVIIGKTAAAAFSTMTINGNSPDLRMASQLDGAGNPVAGGANGPGVFSDTTTEVELKIVGGNGEQQLCGWECTGRFNGGTEARRYFGSATWTQTAAIGSFVISCASNFQIGTSMRVYAL